MLDRERRSTLTILVINPFVITDVFSLNLGLHSIYLAQKYFKAIIA